MQKYAVEKKTVKMTKNFLKLVKFLFYMLFKMKGHVSCLKHIQLALSAKDKFLKVG